MNNNRRKAIEGLKKELLELESEFSGRLSDLCERLDEISNEEEEYIDAMPESFRDSERGESAQNALDNLENAAQSLEEIRDFDWTGVVESLDSAAE